MLLTIQGCDVVGEDDDEPLPTPKLNNLSNIGEEFSASALYLSRRRIRLTKECLKDNVSVLVTVVQVFE